MKGAIVPLSVIAEEQGLSMIALKRRLKKVDARVGGGLLVRFGDARYGQLYADLTRLRELVPAYAPKDPTERVLEVITDLRQSVGEIAVNVAAIRDNLAVAMPSPSI